MPSIIGQRFSVFLFLFTIQFSGVCGKIFTAAAPCIASELRSQMVMGENKRESAIDGGNDFAGLK
jgi:hypothetical protein